MRKPLIRKNPTASAKAKAGANPNDIAEATGLPSSAATSSAPSLSSRPSLDRQKSYYDPDEFLGQELPLIYKPKVIKKVGDCCYIFHCTVKGNSGSRFNKNMIVLVDQEKGHLLVVNPLRLSPEGEEKLLELGATGVITNLIRLGPSEHAAFEDDYYLTTFGSSAEASGETLQRWAPGPFSSCPHLPVHQTLFDTTNTRVLSLDSPIVPLSPHEDVEVFVFQETVQPEALLWLRSKCVLIAGDCLQYQIDNPFVNEGGRENLRSNGLLQHKIVVSATWLQSQSVVANHSRKVKHGFQSRAQKNKQFFSSSGKFKLRNDFVRLLKLELKRFVSSSGNQVMQYHKQKSGDEKMSNATDTVHSAIREAMERACQLS